MFRLLASASFVVALLAPACRAPDDANAPVAPAESSVVASAESSPRSHTESHPESPAPPDSLVRAGALRLVVAWNAAEQRADTSIAGRSFASAAEVGERVRHELELARRAGSQFVTQLAGEPQVPWTVIEALVDACKRAGVADIEFVML